MITITVQTIVTPTEAKVVPTVPIMGSTKEDTEAGHSASCWVRKDKTGKSGGGMTVDTFTQLFKNTSKVEKKKC